MKTLALCLLFIQPNFAYAQEGNDVNEFCKYKLDEIACIDDFNGIPTMRKLPNVESNEPIKLKVIPYKKNIN